MNKPTCSIDGCTTQAHRHAHGKCWDHHAEDLRVKYAHAAIPKRGTRERMIRRFWASIEVADDGCWDWTGPTHKGYGRISQANQDFYAHRLSYELEYGEIADGMFIDHLCHNPGCVNPEHLREVTPKQNTEHRWGANPNNTSGRHGVSWDKRAKKWVVFVHAGPKVHYVGRYDDLDEAAEAARLKRNELFTHNDRDRNAA